MIETLKCAYQQVIELDVANRTISKENKRLNQLEESWSNCMVMHSTSFQIASELKVLDNEYFAQRKFVTAELLYVKARNTGATMLQELALPALTVNQIKFSAANASCVQL